MPRRKVQFRVARRCPGTVGDAAEYNHFRVILFVKDNVQDQGGSGGLILGFRHAAVPIYFSLVPAKYVADYQYHPVNFVLFTSGEAYRYRSLGAFVCHVIWLPEALYPGPREHW